ncbi:MAG: SpoIIE family protein phosphatase [Chloroflexota bacterium]|jgi:serine phosphatase RsbU (regulator of sigma subunit)
MSTGTTSIFRSIFKGLDERALDTLRELAQLRTYPPETMLCHQGKVEHTFYVIVEGMVAISQVLEDGQERMLNILRPRQYFGELGLLDDTPRMANCVTITTTTVLEITEEVFQTVLENSPAVAYSLMRHVVDMLRNTDKLAIADLTDKNQELQSAYEELKAAQADLVEKERLERELEIAASVQRTLLPASLPEVDDYRFAAFLNPARRVGGDFYDVMVLNGEHVGLVLADVADKSVQAALFMAVTRTLFMVESRRSLSPSQVAADVHRGVMDVAPSADIFVTAFYGVLHRPSGKLTYVSAGHERPILIRADGRTEQLEGNGRFLGMLDPLELVEFSAELQPGDRLVIFSDGVPDAVNEAGTQYGYQRMRDYLKKNREWPIKFLVDGLASDVAKWQGELPAFDDLTLLILEMTKQDG